MSGAKQIRTAVIDDGISGKLYNIGHLDFDIVIDKNLSVYPREGYNAYLPSHGTTCAAIIKKYAPDVCIGSIKILNDTSNRGMRSQFTAAVDWCIKNEIKLINLSLGTVVFRDFDDIRHFVNKAAENGLIFVAACNNKNTYTVPACLTNVIGVKCRKLFFDDQYKFNMYPFDGIDIEASGRHLLADVYGRNKYTRPANSFASPLVTAIVHKILSENPNAMLEEIKEALYRNALNFRGDSYNPYICMNTDWLERDNESGEFPEYCCKSTRACGSIASKVWIEEQYNVNIHKCINSIDFRHINVDIPVIAVFDTEKSNVLDRLNLLFSDKGYYSVKVSTEYKDIVYGSEYLPESVEIGQFIAMVYKKYFCDVMILRICNMEKLEYIKDNILFDIILHVSRYEDNINYNDISRNTPACFMINQDDIDKQLTGVFEKMLELLEGAD